MSSTYGFEFVYRLCGAGPTIKNVLGKGTAALSKGDAVTLSSGELVLGTTAGSNFLGVCLETATAATHRFPVIVDDDAVYSVTDGTARKIGDTLDLQGASGHQNLAASSNKEFVVVEDSTASEPTRVRFNHGKHHFTTAL